MEMHHADEPPVSVSHSSKNCCVVSLAPSPEKQTWAGSFGIASVPAVSSGTIPATRMFQSARSLVIAEDSSPPPLQPLLCTFLI